VINQIKFGLDKGIYYFIILPLYYLLHFESLGQIYNVACRSYQYAIKNQKLLLLFRLSNMMTQKSNTDVQLYRSDEQPFGRSWEHWTTKWWQWFLTIPKENHPAYDTTGERFATSQSDPNVWFIAGTISGRAERSIKITPGKALLFPVINVTTSYSENPVLKNEADMISYVKSNIDDIVKKQVSIDGDDFLISEDFRVQTPRFKFTYPQNNIYGAQEGPTEGVGDGYWIFLKSLTPGKHIIKTSGACMSGKIQIDVNIQLTVEDVDGL